MPAFTFNPVAGANSPMDGFSSRFGVDQSFSDIRAGAGNVSNDTDATFNVQLRASTTGTQFSELYRPIMCFDTASLSGYTIASATLSLYVVSVSTGLGTTDFTLEIVAATPASTSAIADADYSQLGSTSFSSKAYASISTSAYNDFILNASGLTNINKTGVSKFGARSGWDLTGSFTGTWSSSATNNYVIQSADNGSNKPKLVVNTLEGGSFLFNLI